jgi:quercetin dioxygenase-like cupin family protein
VIAGPEDGERLQRGERFHRGSGLVVEPHVHEDHADSFYVLEGECEFTYGEDVVRGGPGTWVSVPPGTRHGFRNAGEGDLRLLNVHAPRTGFVAELREA